LYDENKVLLPFNLWIERGVLHNNFLIWRGIVSADSNRHKNVPNVLPPGGNKEGYNEPISVNDINTQNIYNILKTKNQTIPSAQIKYNAIFRIKKDEWKNIYLMPRLCTKDNTLKEFQFKILHRYLGTNKMLYTFKISSHNRCRLCNLQIETLNHIFYECQISYNFWLDFMEWWQERYNEKVTLFCKDVLLGYSTEDIRMPKCLLLNKFLLIGKRMIFASAYRETLPDFKYFLKRIELYYQTEKNSKKSA